MIVSRPSISTTGPASEARARGSRAAGRARLAASSCSSAVVGAGLLEDVDRARWAVSRHRAGSVGCASVPRVPGVDDHARSRRKRDLNALHQAAVPAPPRRPAVGAAADLRAHASSSTASKNPFFEHAEAEYFLAWRDGEPVGRITRPDRPPLGRVPGRQRRACSASSSARTTRRSPRRCSTPPTDWLRERGRERMVGPMDFTTNDECGLLIEGYERPPMILEPWHPPYYQRADRGAGLEQGDGPADVGAAARRAQGGRRASPADPRGRRRRSRASTA